MQTVVVQLAKRFFYGSSVDHLVQLHIKIRVKFQRRKGCERISN